MEKKLKQMIQEKIKGNKVYIGLNSTLRASKSGQVSAIVFASNASEDLINTLNTLDIPKYEYEGDSEALSIALGKSFNIVVLGLKK